MAKRKIRNRRPKLPISNITGFPSGMSHADLRRKFPIFRASIAEHIAASDNKIGNCVKCFHALPFKVDYSRF